MRTAFIFSSNSLLELNRYIAPSHFTGTVRPMHSPAFHRRLTTVRRFRAPGPRKCCHTPYRSNVDCDAKSLPQSSPRDEIVGKFRRFSMLPGSISAETREYTVSHELPSRRCCPSPPRKGRERQSEARPSACWRRSSLASATNVSWTAGRHHFAATLASITYVHHRNRSSRCISSVEGKGPAGRRGWTAKLHAAQKFAARLQFPCRGKVLFQKRHDLRRN